MDFILFYYYIRTAITFLGIQMGGYYFITIALTDILDTIGINSIDIGITLAMIVYLIFFIVAFDMTNKSIKSLKEYLNREKANRL